MFLLYSWISSITTVSSLSLHSETSDVATFSNIPRNEKFNFDGKRRLIRHETLIALYKILPLLLSEMKIQIHTIQNIIEPTVTLNWLSPPTPFKQKRFLFTNWHFRLFALLLSTGLEPAIFWHEKDAPSNCCSIKDSYHFDISFIYTKIQIRLKKIFWTQCDPELAIATYRL